MSQTLTGGGQWQFHEIARSNVVSVDQIVVDSDVIALAITSQPPGDGLSPVSPFMVLLWGCMVTGCPHGLAGHSP